uniref:Uncharacterized protein n=1 Tax=Candidatus Kentrum sp. TUN TaxID=2126343 RepID=A0A450ZM64_9GAMM|nr:MAG: hypothetical protein BECKTUN1418F_GA0071002_10586 [Candidatus Kentron sp. TUN]
MGPCPSGCLAGSGTGGGEPLAAVHSSPQQSSGTYVGWAKAPRAVPIIDGTISIIDGFAPITDGTVPINPPMGTAQGAFAHPTEDPHSDAAMPINDESMRTPGEAHPLHFHDEAVPIINKLMGKGAPRRAHHRWNHIHHRWVCAHH